MTKEELIYALVKRGDLHQSRIIEMYNAYTFKGVESIYFKTQPKQFAKPLYWISEKKGRE